jgi:hypothetical protein
VGNGGRVESVIAVSLGDFFFIYLWVMRSYRIISKVFETGRKYAQAFKENMTIQFDDFLPKWNYTAAPQSP